MGVFGIDGLLITVYPPEGRRYDSPEYDLLRRAAPDLEMPLSLHLATNRLGSGEGSGNRPGDRRFSILPNSDFFVSVSVADMIPVGVFERFPMLQVGAVEQQIGWVPFFLDRGQRPQPAGIRKTRVQVQGRHVAQQLFSSQRVPGFPGG